MEEPILLAAPVRTPIGRYGGGLASVSAVELGTVACRAALERAGIRAADVDHLVFGHARQAGCGPNPARQVAVACGVPVDKPAETINQACLSGLQSVMEATRLIRLGEAEVVLAGGMESMSRVPYLFDARFGLRMGHGTLVDGMYRDGFLDPISGKLMGQTAETLAERYGIGREEQDAFAVRSQHRCQRAIEEKRFAAEIVPVSVETKKGTVRVETDEHPRAGVRAESLAKLPTVFDRSGTVTAGNSCGITDGAAAVVVVSDGAAKRLGIEPDARWIAHRVDGVDPAVMGIGPVPAVRNLFAATGRSLDDVDLIELNEAFAAQVLAVDKELHFDPDRLNVNGGAIALGHPIGCSGARILVTLIHEMKRSGRKTGLATLCVSGGLGGAMLVEAA